MLVMRLVHKRRDVIMPTTPQPPAGPRRPSVSSDIFGYGRYGCKNTDLLRALFIDSDVLVRTNYRSYVGELHAIGETAVVLKRASQVLIEGGWTPNAGDGLYVVRVFPLLSRSVFISEASEILAWDGGLPPVPVDGRVFHARPDTRVLGES